MTRRWRLDGRPAGPLPQEVAEPLRLRARVVAELVEAARGVDVAGEARAARGLGEAADAALGRVERVLDDRPPLLHARGAPGHRRAQPRDGGHRRPADAARV